MSQSVVPIKIRPYLIPFFYKEFKGTEEAHYLNKKVKSCKISLTSSLGKMFRNSLVQIDYPEKIEKFNVFITVNDVEKTAYTAGIYKCVSGQYSFLKVPEKIASDINDILEDQFRLSFLITVQTAIKYAPNVKVKDVIEDFMVEYKLDEYGYQLNSLRRLCERWIAEDTKMSRMQSKVSNRVLNYKV